MQTFTHNRTQQLINEAYYLAVGMRQHCHWSFKGKYLTIKVIFKLTFKVKDMLKMNWLFVSLFIHPSIFLFLQSYCSDYSYCNNS